MSLTFADLRKANAARLPLFRNKKGEPCHTENDANWTYKDYTIAILGEAGEICGWIKSHQRGEITYEEMVEEVAKELGDVQTYLDILANKLGISLEDATSSKFNEVSNRVGVNIKL